MSQVLPEPTGLSEGVTGQGRFAELTYTSFDDGSGSGGGWQVKSTSGDVSDRERSVLTAWISTRFDLEPALLRFPTPADIDGRPVRLMYATADCGGGYWHTVDAGLDGSGRPGNVFAHVLLDRDIEASTAMRPVELWKWSGWLTPYGAKDVLESALAATRVPVPDGPMTRTAVIEFLVDPKVFRQDTFQLLLDAVAAAIAGGPAVVLTVSDTRTAVMWIGAVSYFMSPGTARRFAWSTHDRAYSVTEGIRRGLHLIAVPASDADAVRGDPASVVIDENEEPSLGLLGGEPHVTKDGTTTVAVTPWSFLAQSVLIDAQTAETVLAKQDEIANEVGDVGLSPMWPLAMTVAADPTLQDVHPEAMKVIVEDSPHHVRDVLRLHEQVQRSFRVAAPRRAADAWDLLMQLDVHHVNASAAAEHYVERALGEDDWLFGAAPLPVIPGQLIPELSAEVRQLIDSVVSDLIEDSRSADCEEASFEDLLFRALRVASLVVPAVESSPDRTVLYDRLSDVLDGVGLDVLFDGGRGPGFVASVGPLSEATLRNVVRPAVGTAHNMQENGFGSRVSRPVLGWLFPKVSADPAEELPDPSADVLFAEYVHAVLVAGDGTEEERDRVLPYADLAVRHLLLDEQRTDDGARTELAALTGAVPMTLADIVGLFGEFGDRVPPGVAADILLLHEYDADLEDLIRHVLAQGPPSSSDTALSPSADDIAFSAASIRQIQDWAIVDHRALDELVCADLAVLLPRMGMLNGAVFPGDLTVNLGVLFVAAHSLRKMWAVDPAHAGASPLPSLVETYRDEITARVIELVASGAMDIDWIAAQAVLNCLSELPIDSGDPTSSDVSGLTPLSQLLGPSWFDQIVENLVARGEYDGPRSTTRIRDALWGDVRNMTAAHGEAVIRNYQSAATQWLRKVGIESPGRSGTWIQR